MTTRTHRRKLEVRQRILDAAFALFLEQGMSTTKIEEICERADVANRTFFNHFATRQDMVRALAESRLNNLHEVAAHQEGGTAGDRLVSLFDSVAAQLVASGDTYREMIGTMLGTVSYGVERGSGLHDTFLEVVKDGVARGELTNAHDPSVLADIVSAAFVAAIVNWTVDDTYSLPSGMKETGRALADILSVHATTARRPRPRRPSRRAATAG